MAKPAEKSAARLAAVQALYQMDVAGKGVIDAMAEFEAHWIGREIDGIAFPPAENALFRQILSGAVAEQRAVDRRIDDALTEAWPLERIEAVLRAILRAGAWELAYKRAVPCRGGICEYVAVANRFYGGDEPGLVNAVLDAIARQVRPKEFSEKKGRAGAGRSDGAA